MPYFERKWAYYASRRKIPVRIPSSGLVFHHQLDEWSTTAATGQTVAYAGTAASAVLPVATTYRGVPCCLFNPDCLWKTNTPVKSQGGAYAGTLSCWVASKTALARWKGSDCIVCVKTTDSNYQRYGVMWPGNQTILCAGKHDTGTVYNIYSGVANNTKWHHWAVQLECVAGWEKYPGNKTAWRDAVWLDGVKVRDESDDYTNYELTRLLFGQSRTADSYGFYIAAVRLYNRLLTENEIKYLAREFEPASAQGGLSMASGMGGIYGGTDIYGETHEIYEDS